MNWGGGRGYNTVRLSFKVLVGYFVVHCMCLVHRGHNSHWSANQFAERQPQAGPSFLLPGPGMSGSLPPQSAVSPKTPYTSVWRMGFICIQDFFAPSQGWGAQKMLVFSLQEFQFTPEGLQSPPVLGLILKHRERRGRSGEEPAALLRVGTGQKALRAVRGRFF